MYLKEITASGFKSFAEKIEISLDGNVTCIVGPNGSGKSNIVDAVRWVLGEQSVKSLRGDGAMSDVIFSGSKSRNALNVASVTLTFDNSDHYLTVPYEEVSIRRKVYRSGENEYYMNGTKCRLKDITELFLDSGIGKESFNIISQGEVQRILSNSSNDRRIIFEEAAGVIKYKKRREEAIRKLERTHNNLERLTDIIDELSLQVEPLKEQSIKAKEYLQVKDTLDRYEVALLAHDIVTINDEYKRGKEKKQQLEEEILNISSSVTGMDAEILEKRNILDKKERELSHANNSLLDVTREKERINSDKLVLEERRKYDSNKTALTDNVLFTKEEIAKLNKDVSLLNSELSFMENKLLESKGLLKTLVDKRTNLRTKNDMFIQNYNQKTKDLVTINHKLTILSREVEEGGTLPNSVKTIVSSRELNGIHNALGNLLDTKEQYSKAIDMAISASKNFIITDDERSAKEAINYLKDTKSGRATFFPISVIKARGIDEITLNTINNEEGFISVAANLVTYKPIYKSIVLNQLGNILIVDTLDNATRISKRINARYKIVTLTGDVVNVGGSMSGGSSNYTKSIISLRQEYQNLEKDKQLLEENLKTLEQEQATIQLDINEIEEKIRTYYETVNAEELKCVTKKEQLELLLDQLEQKEKDINSLNKVLSNESDQEEERLIKLYYDKVLEEEKLILLIDNLTKEIDFLREEIEQVTASDKVTNSTLKLKERELRDIEILISKYDVKLDNMLTTLSEDYSLTFEKAKETSRLDIEVNDARQLVQSSKEKLKKIGMVNLLAIEEFERVNTRYEFLTTQKEDLLRAKDTLLDIITEMDQVMKEEFHKTFELIKEEFKTVFKQLFNGGNADLKLTNPDNLLETGIEIVASPPGKKLTTISLLSGGEKTLTAISLLFAILNIRTVPFCLFDEVEAALDEANVDQFGKYLDHYKNKTQFLIITHKKKTMEYAETLYGITMQESGVSKLVSVKLNSDK